MKITYEWNPVKTKDMHCWQVSTPYVCLFKTWDDQGTTWCIGFGVLFGEFLIWINK